MENAERALPHDAQHDGNSPNASTFWPAGWWRWMDSRIGVVPWPVYLLLLGVLGGLAATGKMRGDLPTGIALVAVGGFACAELAARLPLLKHIGAASIFAAFIPSCLVYYGWIPEPMVKAVTVFTKSTNFLYLFIAAIIVGSILSMDRRVLVRGFIKIFVPLAAGSVLAALVGVAVGSVLGLGARHTLFFVVIPIMAGGVGEGAIPLSTGYAAILHQGQGALFAQVVSAAMMGNIAAILLSGLLSFAGRKYPHLTGNGRLQPGEAVLEAGDGASERTPSRIPDMATLAAAGITAITFYLVGQLTQQWFGWPAPVVMLFLAVAAQLARAVSPTLQAGAAGVFKFFSTAVTYPLMFAISVASTPWPEVTSAFHWANIVTALATVGTLVAVGFVVGRWMKLYPIDMAIVNACHSGLGGTGDVAILTAADRMALMPFSQIATRIGGAITVSLALIALTALGAA